MHDILSRLRTRAPNRNTTETKTYIFRSSLQHRLLSSDGVTRRAQTMMSKTSATRLWAPVLLLGGMMPLPLWASAQTAQPASSNVAQPVASSSQASPVKSAASPSVTRPLLDKARAFEQRGRIDMAVQTWQQVLLADPNNTEALAGLASAAKDSGDTALSNSYLDRLRAINPDDPNIAKISGVSPPPKQATQIRPANKAAPAPAAVSAPPSQRTAVASTPTPAAASKPGPIPSSQHARAAEELAAYDALNTDHLGEAESLFQAILAADPKNARAVAGMGYVRMQQGNFSGAVSYLDQAHRDDPTDAALAAALDTARFWFTINEAKLAFGQNDLATAEKRYRAAVVLRPGSLEALNGLGETLMKEQQPGAAIPVFESAVQSVPNAADAWRNLFLAQLQSGQPALALAVERRIPVAAHTQLMSDPLFLRSLASAYSAVGRDGDAQTVLVSALKLPFPADAKGAKLDTQFQYAGILLATGHFDQAYGLYHQVLAQDSSNAAAWQGLIEAEHGQGHDAEALQTLQDMPPATNAIAMRDPVFLSDVASVNRGLKKLDVAQDLLRKAIAQQTAAGQKPSVAIEIELAGVFMDQGSPQLAFPIYRRAANDSPNQADAWAGLVASLHLLGRDEDAAAASIPAKVNAQLQNNIGYLRTMASVYAALGQPRKAAIYLGRAEQVFADQGRLPPADVEIQQAWLLCNGFDDAALYRELMMLGGRSDLTEEQRRTVQTIWANWAVRDADQDAAAGDSTHALMVLNAAAKSFAANPAVLRVLADGYVHAGQPRQAVAIYKSPSVAPVSLADFQVAVDAALAANEKKDAQQWAIQAQAMYPRDPQVLMLAGKVEQARGNASRANEDYRASQRATPPQDSTRPPQTSSDAASAVPEAVASTNQTHDLAVVLAPDAASSAAANGTGASNEPYLPSLGPTPTPQPVPPNVSNPAAPDAGKGGPKGDVRPQSHLDLGVPGQAAAAVSVPGVQPQSPGSSAEVYGPYVPYVAPAKPVSTSLPSSAKAAAPAPGVIAVQSGDSTPHPSANPAQAAQTRRHPNPAAPGSTATAADAAYTTQASHSQVSRPATRPSASAGTVSDTGTQQYPQPRITPRQPATQVTPASASPPQPVTPPPGASNR
jgi:cellulose synthase operon protein C